MQSKEIKETDIINYLNIAVPTSIFTYQGVIDTIISPADSVRHTLSLLQAGFMVTNPKTGNIMAWVGGVSLGQVKKMGQM